MKKGDRGERMSENLIYCDLNLTEPTRPRLQKVTHVQDSTYTEVKVQPLDTNVTSYGKIYCSRTQVAVLIAVIVFILVLIVCLILLYFPTASRTSHSKTNEKALVTPKMVLATETGKDPRWSGENYDQDHTGCPHDWKKNGQKCYFFSEKKYDWNASRKECQDMKSDLVIIDNKNELNYLISQSRGHYYLLGLMYSNSEEKWKWINNTEHRSELFDIKTTYSDYFCAVIGHEKIETASCNGSSTTQNMCEKATSISER
ncbi:C-type lectin domain family 5 member A-like isoform X1 [Colius striatus]|uniref:C-type lectin domain family 5 member A-like isoform X1 n=1 Tax=Colius striatus TaxID=57412 RepID=UPI002B1D2AE9|nr:C-type lectin domain family 5 member A-like isoform X1 [Colius striatus]